MDELSYEVIGAAIMVHKEIGPGLLESLYHKCMMIELSLRGLEFQTELHVPLFYRGVEIETKLKCDLLVEHCLVVELKAVSELHSIFEAQLLTYMKMLHCPKGALINFNCDNIVRNGQKTFVNKLYRDLPP